MADYQVHDLGPVHYIVHRATDAIVGAFYAMELAPEPGWWWGHAFYRAQKLYLPEAEPLDVAVALMAQAPDPRAFTALGVPPPPPPGEPDGP